MTITFAYPAVFKRDEDGRLLVSFADFPTSHTDGADANQAMEEAILQQRALWITELRRTIYLDIKL